MAHFAANFLAWYGFWLKFWCGSILAKILGLHGCFGVNIPCLTDQGEKKFDSIFSAWFFGLKRVVGENCVVVHFQNSYFWLCTLAHTGWVIRCSSSKGLGVWLDDLGQKRGFGTLLGKICFWQNRVWCTVKLKFGLNPVLH